MNSKERVYAALNRKPVDRVPVFMWFHPDTAKHLAELLEIPVAFVPDAMGNDVKQTWVNNNYAMEGITHEKDGETHVDYWGIKWEKQGAFNQIVEYPLAHSTKEDILKYHFPVEHTERLLHRMNAIIEHKDNCFIGCDVSPCVFEMYNRLRGMENAMIDMAMEPDFAREMFSRCADFSVWLAEKACARFGLDWLWLGDDVASQQSMMMNPESWRKMIKPNLKRVVDVAKQNRLWSAYHSCGSVRSIIPDLIEIGLDVLNPIQSNCPGMESLELKKEFGNKLAFMGGVDTQGILPNGTVAEVRRATARLIEGMTKDGGGYILAASHTIPPETPDDNIFAMYSESGISKEEIFDCASKIRVNISNFDKK